MFIKLPVSHIVCSKRVKVVFALISLLICSHNSQAEELPLWELGLGLGALHQPYYVGTKQNRTFAFPVPVPIYRGKVLKSDDEGMRAELLNNDRYKLDLSLDFNLAIDSDDVDLRAGMPDVDSRLQVGPSLAVKLAEGEHDQWLLNLPLRASIGVGSNGVDESGVTFAPNLTYFVISIGARGNGERAWRLARNLVRVTTKTCTTGSHQNSLPTLGRRTKRTVVTRVHDCYLAYAQTIKTDSGFGLYAMKASVARALKIRLW